MATPTAPPVRNLDAEPVPFGGALHMRCLPPTFRRFEMVESLYYPSERLGAVVHVPVGAEHDFASIPRPLWWLLPPAGRYAPAAVVHDHLYRTGRTAGGRYGRGVSRREADAVFLDAMQALGVGCVTRYAMWAAVRLFGGCAFLAGPRDVPLDPDGARSAQLLLAAAIASGAIVLGILVFR